MSPQTLSGRVLQKLSAAFIFDLKLPVSLTIRKKNRWLNCEYKNQKQSLTSKRITLRNNWINRAVFTLHSFNFYHCHWEEGYQVFSFAVWAIFGGCWGGRGGGGGVSKNLSISLNYNFQRDGRWGWMDMFWTTICMFFYCHHQQQLGLSESFEVESWVVKVSGECRDILFEKHHL